MDLLLKRAFLLLLHLDVGLEHILEVEYSLLSFLVLCDFSLHLCDLLVLSFELVPQGAHQRTALSHMVTSLESSPLQSAFPVLQFLLLCDQSPIFRAQFLSVSGMKAL